MSEIRSVVTRNQRAITLVGRDHVRKCIDEMRKKKMKAAKGREGWRKRKLR